MDSRPHHWKPPEHDVDSGLSFAPLSGISAPSPAGGSVQFRKGRLARPSYDGARSSSMSTSQTSTLFRLLKQSGAPACFTAASRLRYAWAVWTSGSPDIHEVHVDITNVDCVRYDRPPLHHDLECCRRERCTDAEAMACTADPPKFMRHQPPEWGSTRHQEGTKGTTGPGRPRPQRGGGSDRCARAAESNRLRQRAPGRSESDQRAGAATLGPEHEPGEGIRSAQEVPEVALDRR